MTTLTIVSKRHTLGALWREAPHGASARRQLVAEGRAMTYQQYSRDYVSEERRARAARRGIWAGEVQPPREWRREQRRR